MSKSKDQYHIFVVDDEPLIVSTLGQILRLQGFEVSCFTNPLKALEAMHSKTPDFLISDVVMPEMSGIELAIVVRETCPACTVLLFSGQFATHQMLTEARNRGHDFEVLAKPVHPVEILARIFGSVDPGAGSDGSNNKLLS